MLTCEPPPENGVASKYWVYLTGLLDQYRGGMPIGGALYPLHLIADHLRVGPTYAGGLQYKAQLSVISTS